MHLDLLQRALEINVHWVVLKHKMTKNNVKEYNWTKNLYVQERSVINTWNMRDESSANIVKRTLKYQYAYIIINMHSIGAPKALKEQWALKQENHVVINQQKLGWNIRIEHSANDILRLLSACRQPDLLAV